MDIVREFLHEGGKCQPGCYVDTTVDLEVKKVGALKYMVFVPCMENGLDKLGKKAVDKGGECCVVQHGFKGEGRFGGLAEHDTIKVGFGMGEAEAYS